MSHWRQRIGPSLTSDKAMGYVLYLQELLPAIAAFFEPAGLPQDTLPPPVVKGHAMSTWMVAWNETQGERLLRVRRCSSFLRRLRGLTFRRAIGNDEGILLVGGRESRADTAIHMFFVFFPIAVIWLDKNGKIVDTILARPFRPFYAPYAPARDVLEGPPSLLEKVKAGDRVRFEEQA